MSLAPSPSSGRGQITIQPLYFTSSTFIHPARADVDRLIRLYSRQYVTTHPSHPFTLFKEIWVSQGWIWIHFKVFDVRSREAFLRAITRLFSERLSVNETPLSRVTALFGLYTMLCTQPSTSAPPLCGIAHVQVTYDLYNEILSLPNVLNLEYLIPTRPHAIYVLSALLKAQVFHVLPRAELHPLNPRELPREIFVQDTEPTAAEPSTSGGPMPKKKGRPSKREKMKKARDSLASLDGWLTNHTHQPSSAIESTEPALPVATHVLLSHPPITSRDIYRSQKSHLLHAIDPSYPYSVCGTSETNSGRAALGRANEAVVERLRKIDEEAAAQGLEVGGEGGERTGLQRVERAVGELGDTRTAGGRGGILGLLEGAGICESGGLLLTAAAGVSTGV
ncbi:hypothetical protein PAXRUDRAFT_826161 [Paxillus rubicundulus Ve08.2h10]|uniref:Uncharacterized protein n=1 Tax=Paxillus rubicundulus Ve08.2h10 TaxID=930991 RepID=A0A0D0DSA2_9AGAM|nr:hypothetical protein PAXRUDRAFT_826161 [Paxillus rubicundulus Ve08.2h10]